MVLTFLLATILAQVHSIFVGSNTQLGVHFFHYYSLVWVRLDQILEPSVLEKHVICGRLEINMITIGSPDIIQIFGRQYQDFLRPVDYVEGLFSRLDELHTAINNAF